MIEVYDNPAAPQNGLVLVNGGAAAAGVGQVVRSGRTLAIVTDVQQQGPGNILDQLDDPDDSTQVVDETEASGPKAAAQFDRVFGTCDELDRRDQHRCRVDNALKAFLSHWLVGGEMPPKTELR